MHLVDGFVDNIKDGLKNGAADFIGSTEAIIGVANKNPEKMRALLNLMLRPQFKPTFIKDEPPNEEEFQSLAPAVPEQTPSIPSRMFDIDTGNMSVDWLGNDDVSQYCILSHSWKGNEVDLAFVNEAREHNRKGDAGAKNDVEMIMNLARHKVEEKKATIEALLKASGGDKADYDAGKILAEYIEVKMAKKNLKKARKARDDANRKRMYTKQEAGAFRKLAREMEDTISADACQSKRGANPPPRPTDESDKELAEKEAKAEKEVKEAETKLQEAAESETVKNNAKFFNDAAQTPLREAIDGLNEALYKWKSAIKIDQSIRKAVEIFDEKLFPTKGGGKRYLWNDTCCIDKPNHGELVDSLSLMGDWYANADFCLVHLDTAPSDDEWNDEWVRFSQSPPAEPVLPNPPNIDEYKGDKGILVAEPKWSTRGWTLQELVLSKTTFYVNSAWQRLKRPQERLGHYYFLCPFVELYTGCEPIADAERKRLRKVWRETVEKYEPEVFQSLKPSDANDEADDTETRISAGQYLIAILEAFGLNIPHMIDRDTAIPLINQAVYIVTTCYRNQETEEDSRKVRLYLNLKKHISPSYETSPISETDLGRTIKFLLRCLVAETKAAILEDRAYIAQFGKVDPLKSWMGGTTRTSFPTQRVMSLACKRETTVDTDRAYSLMGLLGVRFPTFKAEGLPKALARLFDETLILSNDVSVFNWAGREMGSHIRGRSLYPSRLDAFDTSQSEGQSMANRQLARLLQARRKELTATFHRICDMLHNAIAFLKKYDHHTHLPIKWIEGIIELVYAADLEDLDPQVDDLESILKWIQNKCASAWASKGDPKARGHGLLGSLAKHHPVEGLKLSTLQKKRSLSGLFDSASRSSKRVKTETGSPASPCTPSSPADTLVDPPYDEATLKDAVNRLNQDVNAYLQKSRDTLGKHDDAHPRRALLSKLPQEVLDELTRNTDTAPPPPPPSSSTEHHHHHPTSQPPTTTATTISPNPITVTTSGIDGTFDIHRIVTAFHEEAQLRAQVRAAVSPRQRVAGWCSVSTGFARVMVSFSCEAHVLAKQLKIAQVVRRKVVENDGLARREREEGWLAAGVRNGGWGRGEGGATRRPNAELRDGVVDAVEEKAHRAHHTEDERRVSRMIAFVQEEPLEAVAGEWVLARFSDVGCASWFLCALELGSSHGFYGQRVATDRIDFADAIPEPGLVNVWQSYMDRKKRKLCYILNDFLASRALCSKKDLIFSHGREKGEGEEDLEKDDGVWEHAWDVGVTAVKNAGTLTTYSLREAWHNMMAERLDSHLTAVVLKYTPKDLQPAVENLNADQDFLPAAFRSGTRVHMF
ncbi:uncharacterized protein BKCO1_36000105 [Diplodia corticola]|uniref:Heterokaryon incompatibility domain-containing protein n=1 Tax=Diplodia corticola TaxID=236234 RepID=A0A1J9QUZ9_9PEZI|nr:uncharacterized protein BKCO1_36000105 [Diplodia corticola]OJD32814.1 hypothetical protein BKCO1_36000105 [Diplodia corticola]